MPYANRETRLAYLKDYRAENPDMRDRSDYRREYRDRNREAVREIKESTPCMDCGKQYPWYVMDFDHRDPQTKTHMVSKLVIRASLKVVLAEIEKCDLVCANCHRIRTYLSQSADPEFGYNREGQESQQRARARRRRAHVDRMQQRIKEDQSE